MYNKVAVEIYRSADVIFPYLDNAEKQKLWMRDMLGSSKPVGEPTSLGQQFEMTFGQSAGSRTAHTEVVEFTPNQQIKMRMSDPSFSSDMGFTLEPSGGGTLVTYDVESTMHNPILKLMMGTIGFIMTPMASRQLKGDLTKLKRLVES